MHACECLLVLARVGGTDSVRGIRQPLARRTAGPEAGMQSAEYGPVMLQVVPGGQHPWVVEDAGQHTASGPKWQHPYLP